MSDLFIIPQNEVETIGQENSIYGFPLVKSIKIISDELKRLCGEYKIYYIKGIDLGCGNGEVVHYINYHVNSLNDESNNDKEINDNFLTSIDICEFEGVELSEYRISKNICNNINENSNYICTCNLITGDLLKLYYGLYNVIYCGNVCFDDTLVYNIEQKMIKEFTGIYITYCKIVDGDLLRKSHLINTIEIETNWNKRQKLHYYFISK